MTEKTTTATAIQLTQQELRRQGLGMAWGLLNAGQVIGEDGQIIVLAFPSSSLRDRVAEDRHQIARALRDVQDFYLDVVFIVSNRQ